MFLKSKNSFTKQDSKILWLIELHKTSGLFYLAIIIFLFCLLIVIVTQFRYIITSSYFKLNKNYISKEIIVVALDTNTINSEKFKRFQDINRCDYTTLLRNILYWDPKVIWVDIVFYQKSSIQSCDNELKNILIKNNNIIIWTEFIEEKWGIVNLFWSDKNIKNIAFVDTKSYNDLNFFSFGNTQDLKNKIPIYYTDEDPILPLSFEIYKRFNNITSVEANNDYVLFSNGNKVPVKDWLVNINFFSKDYKVISFIDVLENNVDNNIFKDKVVFIWATASDIHDEFLTPLDTANFMPWVFIHANMFNTLLTKKYLYYENIFSFLILNFILFLIFILIFLKTKNILSWIIYSFLTLIWFILISVILFVLFWILIEIFPTIIAYIFISLAIYLKKYFEEKKSKDQIKSMFSKYISEDVANELIKLWIDSLKLWWREKVISVFFSDLAWFTDLSEKLSPDNLGKILNIYFEEMSSIILNNKWTIDKFIWDAIMAFWNAPLDNKYHADAACTTALLQRQALEKVRIEVKKMWVESKIDMRIGINTGPAVVWNFWCSKRYDYTVLWDTVNLASRLESINKQYGTNVMISENTYNALIDKSKFITRELDMITVKWKIEPIKIYELIWFDNLSELEKIDIYKEALKYYKNNETEKSIIEFKKIGDTPSQNFIKRLEESQKISNYKEALSLYRDKKFKQAKEVFIKIWDTPSQKFIERCDDFIANPPEENWDWVYRFKIK